LISRLLALIQIVNSEKRVAKVLRDAQVLKCKNETFGP